MANRQYRISKGKSVFISWDGGCAYLMGSISARRESILCKTKPISKQKTENRSLPAISVAGQKTAKSG